MPLKPNIVFILTDQMRAQATGYAGDPNVKTPCLDKLAEESINFTTAVSNCPVCTPYRACLLSGQYPLTHGLFLNDLCLPDNGNSLAQIYKRAGYDTAYVGKWHLDGHGRCSYIPPERRQGFDYWKVLECTHAYNESAYYDNNDENKKFWQGYDAYAQTEDVLSWLATRKNNNTPFVLLLSFGTPHDPYHTAPENLKDMYQPEQLRLRENVSPCRDNLAREQLQGYYAHISAIDACVGKMDKAVDELGIKENTIFIFTSDHGDSIESQWPVDTEKRATRKQRAYDESVLVPFLLRYPEKYAEAKKISTPIVTPDILPTLLSMSGVKIPDIIEGDDFTPVLEGKAINREGVLIACYHPFADNNVIIGGRPYRGIRTAQYTFVRDLNGPWMLFDNHNDPFQLNNLVNKQKFNDIQRRLDAELQRILAEQNDAFDRPEDLRKKYGYEVRDNGEIPFGP